MSIEAMKDMIKWDRPCYKCLSHYCDLSCKETLKQEQGEIERLTAALEKANEQAEHFEREWYLRGDELEKLKQEQGESLPSWEQIYKDAFEQGVHEGSDKAMNQCRLEYLKQVIVRSTPQQRKPLTDEMAKQMKERCDSMEMRGAFADGWLSAEAAHGIKE